MKRIPELDGLRACAVTLVMAYHLWPEKIPWGWAGVDLFFVLSGYLITMIILTKGGNPGFLRSFYARRSLRIWPIYYLLIAALVLIGWGPKHGLGYFLTYTQNIPLWFTSSNTGCTPLLLYPEWPPMRHSWTLAIEEQFYLVWPAAILLCRRRNVGKLSLAILIASAAFRGTGGPVQTLLGRADGLALGSLLAAIKHKGNSPHALKFIAAGILVISWVAPDFMINPIHYYWHSRPQSIASIMGVGLVSYGIVALVIDHRGHRFMSLLRWRPAVFLGTISYGLYFYHYPAFIALREFHSPVAVILVTVAVAVMSWAFVEQPILRLKDRFDYRSSLDSGRESGRQ